MLHYPKVSKKLVFQNHDVQFKDPKPRGVLSAPLQYSGSAQFSTYLKKMCAIRILYLLNVMAQERAGCSII